ncbi:MAG: UbiA family prenyltransferase [Dehalococcoidia bacterium]|nr:UbiA family prenyltransferase [Dehalococcoidia bacterium]MDW8119956.1 UbiA family prenyltransferase [Chloroflexota bacterium]
MSLGQRALAYILVLKPRETLLLALMGWTTALVAADLQPTPMRFLWTALAVLLGSAGANGLTNFLDRGVDARMRRTQRRVLPRGLLRPAEAGIWAAGLVAVSLGMAWVLHPLAFGAGALAVVCALVARKTWATHFLGIVSSCGPVWVAWFAMHPQMTPLLGLLTLLVALWVPVHVWTLMLAYREDYLRAGVNIFPLDKGRGLAPWLCFALSVALLGVVVVMALVGRFGPLFWVGAGLTGLLLAWACWRMARSPLPPLAIRPFRLSAYPFLGAVFLGMPLDRWLMG